MYYIIRTLWQNFNNIIYEVILMYNKKSSEDISVSGKRVLVRCDVNVPLNENLEITH